MRQAHGLLGERPDRDTAEEIMADLETPDHYELLQISPRADLETIQRVFRHLAKRYHPDNPETGDAVRFEQLVEAFKVLSDPTERAKYDIQYAQLNATRWKVFDQETARSDVSADRSLRTALLSILYAACRNDASKPGIGEMDLERLLNCPQEHMQFHVWYLKENGLIRRTDSGTLAITASGVDLVLEMGGPARGGMHLLDSGEPKAEPTPKSKSA